jgi:hypothetical protein
MKFSPPPEPYAGLAPLFAASGLKDGDGANGFSEFAIIDDIVAVTVHSILQIICARSKLLRL